MRTRQETISGCSYRLQTEFHATTEVFRSQFLGIYRAVGSARTDAIHNLG